MLSVHPKPARIPLAFLLIAAAGAVMAGNAFDLSGGLAPPDEIHAGGPTRDRIPALTDPAFVPAAQADFLAPDDRILGLNPAGEARAYPNAILNRHEIVNDGIGGRVVAVTYCPPCGTGVAFDALHTGRRVEFGVSGLLYNSDVLLYNRQTESLWSQIAKQTVTGPMKGQRLVSFDPVNESATANDDKGYPLPAITGFWFAWYAFHPQTEIFTAARRP